MCHVTRSVSALTHNLVLAFHNKSCLLLSLSSSAMPLISKQDYLAPQVADESNYGKVPDEGDSGIQTPECGIAMPLRHAPKSLRPYLLAVMAFKKSRDFQAKPSVHRKNLIKSIVSNEGQFGAALTPLFVGISAVFSDVHNAVVATAIHDSVYLRDFAVKHLELENSPDEAKEDVISNYIISELRLYERTSFSKFIGAGIPYELMKMSPQLCSRLWSELDIVPISIESTLQGHGVSVENNASWFDKCVDEQADSMARKCIMNFGPSMSPLLQVGFRGIVQIDAGFDSHMCTIENFRKSCGSPTWESMAKFANELKDKKTKIAFFSSTPQGGGVALMRHALVRLARVLGVDLTWYVPKPKPGVFRITKTVHNILQGVAADEESIKTEDKKILQDWIEDNASRYWLSEGGPLRPPSEGGADIIVIDDPQMPGLIPLIKNITPDRPVLYRSHIEIRSDLVEMAGTAQADIWHFLWENIQHADLYISHPMPSFVPKNVPRDMVGYLPATTDWLDGLNKPLDEWDMGYYGHLYNMQCLSTKMITLRYPANKYFIQIARFDPSKGIPELLKAYAAFRHLLKAQGKDTNPPQLLIVGNGSVDDPDGSVIYDQTMADIESHYPNLQSSISVMRLEPSDQTLNTLITNAHIVLQLSTREGFEVKVSEGLHKGRPVIATKVGGLQLQVQHGKNGFLVEPGDWRGVAEHLMELWTDERLYESMATYAAVSVSDEVGTVGNALGWFYLAAVLTRKGLEGLKPKERWIIDLAREDAGFPCGKGENRLPRKTTEAAREGV